MHAWPNFLSASRVVLDIRQEHLGIVMELANGGNLFDLVRERCVSVWRKAYIIQSSGC